MGIIDYKRVDFSNYLDAIRLQKSIFPLEDGSYNILESIDINLFKKIAKIDNEFEFLEYYLMYVNDEVVGISGLYQIPDFSDEIWLGCFGIDKSYRRKGYGKKLLNWTIEKAKKMNMKVLRLYTDFNDNANAVKLYEKIGFIGEKYLAEDLNYDCRIYTLPLEGTSFDLWNNRYAGVLEYEDMENSLDKEEVIKSYRDYVEKIYKF